MLLLVLHTNPAATLLFYQKLGGQLPSLPTLQLRPWTKFIKRTHLAHSYVGVLYF